MSTNPFIIKHNFKIKYYNVYWVEIDYLVIPITPQAILAPAFPVVALNSCPPLPKSSWSACTYKMNIEYFILYLLG